MDWLWIILRYLFPRDHLRQGAEALRQRVAQLVHVGQDEAQLAQLLIDPALRRQLEFLILDAEDCLRLWIAMRGCQIAKVRPNRPHARAAPNLTHAKDLPDLLARIHALAAACAAMEKRAQAHAAGLKQLRAAAPLGAVMPRARISPGEFLKRLTGLILRDRDAIVSQDAAMLTARAATRGPPHSIEGATP